MAKKTKQHKIKLSITAKLYIAVALFMVSVILSRGADMMPWEVVVFNHLYNSPEIILPIVFIITQAGSIHMLGSLMILFFLQKRYDILFRLLTTSTLAYLLTGFTKDIWGRLRPAEFLSDVINLDYEVRGPGFPSGHTALAVAMALVMGDYLPSKYKIVVPVWIVSVGFSRIYLGLHAPLDVIGGFAVGWFAHLLISHLVIENAIQPYFTKRSSKR